MHFLYDAQGRMSIVQYDGVDYAYLHNLQGDVQGKRLQKHVEALAQTRAGVNISPWRSTQWA